MRAVAAAVALAVTGAAAAATPAYRVRQPVKLAAEPAGTILIADRSADRVLRLDPRTRRVTAASPKVGPVVSVARDGSGRVYASLDRPKAYVVRIVRTSVTRFPGAPGGLGVAADGDLLSCVWSGKVFRIDSGTRAVTTFAGRGADASDGDGGPAVRAGLFHPHAATAGPDGSVYIADSYAGRIRKVDAGGVISTVASGLKAPIDLAFAPDGSLVVAEAGSGIDRVGVDGTVTAISAELRDPTSVAVTRDGTIYAADIGLGAVFRVDGATGRATKVTR